MVWNGLDGFDDMDTGQEFVFDFKFLELTETSDIKEESLLFIKTSRWKNFVVREMDFEDRYVVISYGRLAEMQNQNHCEVRCTSTGTLFMDIVFTATQLSYFTSKLIIQWVDFHFTSQLLRVFLLF